MHLFAGYDRPVSTTSKKLSISEKQKHFENFNIIITKKQKKSSVVLYAAFVFQVSSSKKTPQKTFLRQYETFKCTFVSNGRLISNQIDSKIVFFSLFSGHPCF